MTSAFHSYNTALILFRALPEFKACSPWIQDLAEAAFIRGIEEGKRLNEPMTEERAKEIWKAEIQPDGGIYCLGHYISWSPGEKVATLDCDFSADELEALVWFMRHDATGIPQEKS